MAVTLQMRRGVEGSLPALAVGEFGWCTDTHKLFVGSAAGNKQICMYADLTTHAGNANAHHNQLHSATHAVGQADALSVGFPVNISTANIEGSATNFARRDHVHAHPSGLGTDLHHTKYTDAEAYAAAWAGKKLFITVATGQQPAAGWTWYDITGASVSWTSSVAEDILVILDSQWQKNTAGAGDPAMLGTKLDATTTEQVLRFTFESDDWPRRGASWFYENVAAGDHTLKLQFMAGHTGAKVQTQKAIILRTKR